MVEYVWALHDFSPEHEDEISFRAGDPIEIVEKDDQYGDGWWQGRAPDGQVGLFPQAYTTTTPPGGQQAGVPELRMPPTLDSLPEESDEGTSPTRDNAVMAATMTDVQHALDQLAVARAVGADDTSRRTFSFIESGTETDHDTTGDEEEEAKSLEGWKGNSRQLLAENAAKANKRAAAAEASNDRLAPPIPVEMSDESEPEEDEITSPLHSPPETARAANFADQGDLWTPVPSATPKGEDPPSSPPKQVEELAPIAAPSPPSPPRSPLRSPIVLQAPPTEDVPPPSATDSHFITATTSSTSSLKSPITPSPPGAFSNEPKLYSEPDPATMPKSPTVVDPPQSVMPPEAKATPVPQIVQASTPAPVLQVQEAEAATTTPSMASIATVVPPQAPPSPKPTQPQLASPISFPSIHSPVPSMPTATIVTQQQQRVLTPVQPTPLSAHFPSPMSISTTGSYAFQPPQAGSAPGSAAPSLISSLEIPSSKSNPAEWTVDQVVEWLKAKKFDDGIVAKFIEHEITGDVLIELDVNMLKELDIAAFGKRMRISNAITELKRSFSAEQSPGGALNGSSGFAMPPALNTSFNSFNAGPISSGSMQNYLAQQQFQASPATMPQNPFAPGQAYGYPPTIPTGSQGPPSSTHTRNQSMSSMAPSGFGGDTVTTDATSVTGGPQIPPALLAQLTNVPEEANKASSTADPGATMTTSASAPSFAPAPKIDEEPHVVLRKGSLRSKPPLSTLTPVDRSASGVVPVWAGGQSQTTLSSVPQSAATDPVRHDQGPETDTEAPPRKSVDERATMSDGEATSGGLKDLKRRMSTRKAVRESGNSFLSAGSDERAATPVSSVAASPSVKTSVFGGSISARRKRNSDEGTANGSASGKPKGERLSFFGGTLGKGRKPVPSEYSDTSPTVSEKAHTHRSLSSRLYLGSHGRKGAVRPATSPGPSESQSMPSSPAARLDADATTARTPNGGTMLRKQINSSPPETLPPSGRRPAPPPPAPLDLEVKPGMTALDQIGQPDHSGWMRKRGESFNAWKLRYFVLKGPHLYYVKTLNETKIKGYINITGYKVVADENVHPGRYGFRIVHETEKPHFFSSVEQTVVREWMKALMKSTIGRDYSRPVVSSCNIPTIPLSIAQTMNPPPRPPSPTARAATQRAMRRENTNQLSSRDALVLMGMAGEPDQTDKARLDNFFREGQVGDPADAPPRPSRELRAPGARLPDDIRDSSNSASDMELISWINNNLPSNSPPATDLSTSMSSGLVLYRLVESVKGLPTDVPDSLFNAEGPEGMFKLFDFMLDNDIRIGNVSINDVRLGNKDKIAQLVKSIRSWQDKREGLVKGMSKQPSTAGPWLAVG